MGDKGYEKAKTMKGAQTINPSRKNKPIQTEEEKLALRRD